MHVVLVYIFSFVSFVSTNYTALVRNMENLQKHQEPKNQILMLCPFSKVDRDLRKRENLLVRLVSMEVKSSYMYDYSFRFN